MVESENSERGNNGTGILTKMSEVFIYGRSMVPALTILLIILVVYFSVMAPNFFTFVNFKAIISNIPVIAIMAIGETFVLLVRGLDVSIGSILGFTAVNVVLFHNAGFNAYVIVLLCVLIGAFFGALNGFIITKIGVNSVITTLGTMALARGLASWFTLAFKVLKVGRVYDQQFLKISRLYFPADKQIIPITLIYIIKAFFV